MAKSEKFNWAVTGIVITVLFFVLTAVVIGTQGSVKMSQKDQSMLEKVKNSIDNSVEIDRGEVPTLTISEASAKEITESDYKELTGNKALSVQNTTFPKLILVNEASQKITGFGLLCKNKNTGRIYFLKIGKIIIAPSESYDVFSRDWLSPNKQVKADSDGNIIKERLYSDKNPTDFDVPEMWMPGKAGDLIVKVGMIEYEDGTTWMMDGKKSTW